MQFANSLVERGATANKERLFAIQKSKISLRVRKLQETGKRLFDTNREVLLELFSHDGVFDLMNRRKPIDEGHKKPELNS